MEHTILYDVSSLFALSQCVSYHPARRFVQRDGHYAKGPFNPLDTYEQDFKKQSVIGQLSSKFEVLG